MKYIWKVIHLTGGIHLEAHLNDLERDGWSIWAASVDCVIARKRVDPLWKGLNAPQAARPHQAH